MPNRQHRSSSNSPLITLFQLILFAMSISCVSTGALAEKINLNQADSEALQYIPGIGPNKSEKIIEERNKVGQFTDIQQLLSVPGIGEKILQALKQYGALDKGVSLLTPEMKDNPPNG
ncbi:MAG: hypothetical protein GKR96_09225 [Gammaproteobacteria bacterium]|nr:hypothetical protein [Gammaproteobacteria bacterium]